MLFSSLIFIFLFLTVTLFVNNVLLRKSLLLQNIFLTLASLFFYAWGEPFNILLMLGSIALNWLSALWVSRLKAKGSRLALPVLIVCLLLNFGALFYFKYLNFSLSLLNRAFGASLESLAVEMPIGISFFTFQAVSYVVDVYRQKEDAHKNPLYVAFYISFFPQLIAGPIVRYSDISQQIQSRALSFDGFAAGVKRFLTGLARKVLLSNVVGAIADRAFALDCPSPAMAWLGAIAYAFQIYYDFSGYSDMAIGRGLMFGIRIPENFNHPYTSSTVKDFWRRWHMTLSVWFRDYVYIPLGGNRSPSAARRVLNLLAVWALTGLWHGANMTFLVWGLWYFVLLSAERALGLSNKNTWYTHLYTLFFVLIGWVIFRAPSLSAAGQYIGAMFGLGTPGIEAPSVLVLLKENWFTLLMALLFATRLPSSVLKRLQEKHPVAHEAITCTALLLMFVLSLAHLINGTYNPFIYFNF